MGALMTSAGPEPVSLEKKVRPFVEPVARAKSYVPSPVTMEVTSYATRVPDEEHEKLPGLEIGLRRLGWLFQVKPCSVQDPPVVQMVPAGPLLVHVRASCADDTGTVTPWTWNRVKVRCTVGEESTLSLDEVPKFEDGKPLST